MKKINLYFLVLFAFIGLSSCEKDSDELTGSETVGGLLNVKSSLVPYVVGNGNTFNYNVGVRVFQGAVKSSKIDIYKSFTNVDGDVSNEAFLKSISVPDAPQNQDLTITVNYNELISGLTLNGSSLPASDSALNIGDFWTLKYVVTTSEGKVHTNASTTKVSVGTRFAGTYRVLPVSQYWRIGVETTSTYAGWHNTLRTVESVNSTTYRFLDFAGPFEASTNTHYFTIDASDVVRTPVIYDGTAQLLNGFGVINCDESAASIPIACNVAGLQNTVVRDNVDGKDRIYRTYGYYTSSGAVGPREIYEVLEKVVE